MRKLFVAAAAAALCLPLTVAGQDASQQLKDFTRLLPSDGLQLNLVHLNDKTTPVLFQPPTLYAIRARAKEATAIYVQGIVEKNVELDTTDFSISQLDVSSPGTTTSIHNFTKGKLKLNKGDKVDGIVTFGKLIDVTKPFTVHHGRETVDFAFTPEQVKAMNPAPAAH